MAIDKGPQFDGDEQYAEADANQAAFVHHHESFHRALDAAHALHAIVELTGDKEAAIDRDDFVASAKKHAAECARLNDGDPIMSEDPNSPEFGECFHCGRSILR